MTDAAKIETPQLRPCRVLIADDSRLVRTIVSKVMRAELKTLVICGEAADGRDAIDKIRSLQPDIILLDISLPGITGLDVVESFKNDAAPYTFILMSEQDRAVLEKITSMAGLKFCVPKLDLGTMLIPLLKEIARLKPCSVS